VQHGTVRPVGTAILFGLLLTACNGAMSLTEYAETLEQAAVDASNRDDAVNAAISGEDSTLLAVVSGLVPMTTASTKPGIDLRSWWQESPSTSSALGLTASTS